ncbi:MAG: AMP-binding protein [Candidatus Adiutrix sp.]|nr:AMP-binding protein [Candidatus Adiutrix sp.]
MTAKHAPKGKYWDEKIETMPREHIREYQLRLLQEELRYAYDNAPYYKRSFDKAGISPSDLGSLGDLKNFPFIDKKTQRDAQGVGSFLGELAAVPEDDVVFVSTSSGSTGVPTISPFTRQDFDEWQDVESRLFWQAGMRPSDRYIHALNFSLYVGGPDVIGAQNLGALCIWGGTLPSDRLIFILKSYQPTYIWTSPSYAWYLGETCRKNGIDPKEELAIKRIFVAGEMGGSIPATRAAIEALWGAEVFDFYGLSDIFGACAAQCEYHDGLHIAEDHIYVETVDLQTGELLPAGERGELIYTTLRKKARPIIRFRTGDIGIVNLEKCLCGRTHARILVDGRKDDMFIVSAVNVYPSDIEYTVREIPEVTGEYVVRVYEENFTCKYEVTVENATAGRISDGDVAARVNNALRTRCGVKPANVVVLPDGTLERSTHKAKRFIDERVTTKTHAESGK